MSTNILGGKPSYNDTLQTHACPGLYNCKEQSWIECTVTIYLCTYPISIIPSTNSFLENSHCVAALNFHAIKRTFILVGSKFKSSQNRPTPSAIILSSSPGSNKLDGNNFYYNTPVQYIYILKICKFQIWWKKKGFNPFPPWPAKTTPFIIWLSLSNARWFYLSRERLLVGKS